jgi:hypothetical protein
MTYKSVRNLAIFSVLITTLATAQAAKESAPKPERPTSVYKIDYVFYEVQDGKRSNVRNYTTLLGMNDRGSIRLGDRVPVVFGKDSGQVQYLDIGVAIDSRIEQELEGGVGLFTNVDISSVAPEQPGENRNIPVVRQTKFQLEAIVPLGKQTLIGSADEVDGMRRIEIQATATKVR